MGLEIGDTVDAYRITGVVGRGGMGRVYKVEHTITKRVEAMKAVIGGPPEASEQAQRFLREIQLQAKLTHPNIASVYNAFWWRGDLVLVMELVDGPSLQDLLEAGPVPLETAIDYTRQSLRALRYAHKNGIVHRDVSPGNILIAPDGTVKLTDFGLAKALAGPRFTQSGEAMGSVYYAAPEQLKALPTVDERADVYSLGAVLYELVTGETMFDADSLYDVMKAQIEDPPPPPIERSSKVSPALNELILRALEKDPGRRFQSADAFLAALEGAERSPAPVRPKRRRFVPLRTAAAMIVAALTLTALGLAVWNDISSRSAFELPPVAEAPLPPKSEMTAESGPPATPLPVPEPAPPVVEAAAPIPRPAIAKPWVAQVAAPVSGARVEPAAAPEEATDPQPAEISRAPVEQSDPPSPEAIANDPQPEAEPEAQPERKRHWLWRALGKIPLPGGGKKAESAGAEQENGSPP